MNPIFSVEQTPSNPLRSPEVPHYKPGQFCASVSVSAVNEEELY